MAAESSRKTELAPASAPTGCPRCGTRLEKPYKYCPNCAYRLRPDLVPGTHAPPAGAPFSQRAVALGGYLLFAAMLLLVVFAGVRLFAPAATPDLVHAQVIRTRDPGCLPLTLEEFVDVPAGAALWGLYDPGREDMVARRAEAAGEQKREVEDVLSALAEMADATAPADEARGVLREALDRHPSVREALRQWAHALDIAVPSEPVAGIPDAYQVEDPFRMCMREVTNDQYFEFLRAWARKTGKRVPLYLVPSKWKRVTGSRDVREIYNEGEGDFPVVGIPFDAALEFCGWFWEERLGADPDLVVDLPTWKEFLLAARGDRLMYNFPWGRTLQEAPRSGSGSETVNLGTAGLWSVVKGRGDNEFHNGFLDLVGNAAEWVHSGDARAAGWSFEDGWVSKVLEGEPGQPGRLVTPFSGEGFRDLNPWDAPADVGFRPVIRRAPRLPSFVPVTAGLVRHRPPPDGILPPERLDAEESREGDDDGRETIEEIRAGREPLVSFAAETEQVERGFDISATEITNRQYLAFLAAIAPTCTKEEIRAHLPGGWPRHLYVRLERKELRAPGEEESDEDRPPVARAFDGYLVTGARLRTLYAAGQENVPVQGIDEDQAEAYVNWLSARLGRRCALPTVAQYLRAARGDGVSPYPWGDDLKDRELMPCYRPDGVARAFSLPVRTRPIVGLAGNVAELVRDDSGRLLLAGGFYDLPARLATLDCFLDASWDTVQFVHEPEDEGDEESAFRGPRLSATRRLPYHTGFRVVRRPDPF
ncbi:MAG: SUMF1/EgtB/PvdO family nonheme iron enzyme [Planctomycetota bacterium]